LRGQISQGLLLKVAGCYGDTVTVGAENATPFREGDDISEALGIQKWEAPVPANLAGQARSMFPSWGKKTDAERCQNLLSEIKEAHDTDMQFEITIKLDGTSMSAGVGPNGEFHVCSRNLSLKLDQVGNTYVDVAEMYNLESKMLLLGRPLLISGEIIGEGIQKNQEKIKGQDFYVFNVWDPIRSEYLSADERKQIVLALGLKHAPILHESITLRELGLDTVDKILKYAEGPSMNSGSREGLVFKSIDGKFMFKAVSNAWLTKND
jgi:RNA ligase (TIGR02306 family)